MRNEKITTLNDRDDFGATRNFQKVDFLRSFMQGVGIDRAPLVEMRGDMHSPTHLQQKLTILRFDV